MWSNFNITFYTVLLFCKNHPEGIYTIPSVAGVSVKEIVTTTIVYGLSTLCETRNPQAATARVIELVSDELAVDR